MAIRNRLTRRSVAVLGLATVLLGVPVAVTASHQYADVPDGNIYHANIDRITDAGVTNGCGGGNYCPNDAVTRGQMAAFMARGFGAVAHASGSPSLPTDASPATIASVTVHTPGVTGGTGYLHIVASGYMSSPSTNANCPCFGVASIDVNGTQTDAFLLVQIEEDMPFVFGNLDYGTWSLDTVVAVGTNVDVDVDLIGQAYQTTENTQFGSSGTLSVIYAPFAMGPVSGALAKPVLEQFAPK